ncbi:possible glycosyl hydrolase [Aggregatibacter actinomycetemcomitans serotype e str. SC1083]|uniref:Possible glycosyl hydrolase n=1 Tax=Aggregatibacter actinomycetemcomitans serotype e str. SC1083 TaxID=907488 RepID=G4A7C3_AGGAC|nr:GH32 C-terminal domain-containing protein [Aggregatibacter actinomycetemcomitans]EGY34327.1 possible glycosyl hydrolase [Aggregatibacter actinomycetemcomitans serotype e str. SC1083]KYK72625.1 hypothetical protein SA3096_09570 [Aggregatibacter actinomycetemcomitans serotype e str. SA3096]KYK78710.1 hypothetical protein SC936_09105 [Aggregatibacter actinomycetemcomitans serotype e str. SC936]KYK91870.1 hypothetical protein ANH9776_10050 [Aggregatibacter actinomycetemcomitans serotype e str. A
MSYDNSVLYLDRGTTEQTELIEKFGGKCYYNIENLQNMEMLFDRSMVEIFLNDGEKMLTARFFCGLGKLAYK